MDVGLAASLNVNKMRWLENNPDLDFSNVFAILCLCFLIAYPIWIIIFFCLKEPHWEDDDFTSRFGSVFGETKVEKREHKWLPLILPISFLGRRAIFIFSVIVSPEFLWMQLFAQFCISVAMVIYLVWWKPLNSHFANIMETFNEITCIVLMYHLQLFSDFVPSAETRSKLGTSFLIVFILNVSVHLFFMLRETLGDVGKKLKECYERKKKKDTSEVQLAKAQASSEQ